MVLLKKKFVKKRFARSPKFFYVFLGIFIILLVLFLVNANLKINKKRGELLAQINYLEETLQLLEEKKAQYQEGIIQSQTNDFWEEKIRGQGYKKPGEQVFVIVPQEQEEAEKTEPPKNFWQRLWERLKF